MKFLEEVDLLKGKFFTFFFILVFFVACGVWCRVLVYSQEKEVKKEKKLLNFNVGEDSYRLIFELGDPRGYSTRFIQETRTLQLRVSSARAEEFASTAHYDTRFVKRILILEEKSEVIVSIQLKNIPIAWVVATQDKPWRILIDFWRTETEPRELETEWNWQPDYVNGFINFSLAEGSFLTKNYQEIFQDQKVATSGKNLNKQILNKDDKIYSENKNTLKEEKEFEIKKEKFLDNKKLEKNNYFPEIYRRLNVNDSLSEDRKAQLNAQMGAAFGSKDEFLVASKLAKIFYQSGHEEQSLGVFRRLSALSESGLKKDPQLLWYAGESAYLTKNFSLANDYFRSLVLNFPDSFESFFAHLRLTDIDELENSFEKGHGKTSRRNLQKYSEMALSEKIPQEVKIAATLRVLSGVIDENPAAAKIYQQNLDTCVSLNSISFDLLKNCAYNKTRASIEKDSIYTADQAVQWFKKRVPNDQRSLELEKIVARRVKDFLQKVSETQQWEEWVHFEKSARPALIEFSFKESAFLFKRAEAFEAVGENEKAAQLYTVFLKASLDQKKKNEAASLASRLFYRMNKASEALNLLNKIEQDRVRKTEGLTDRSVEALKEISVAPYRNRTALLLLLDDMKLGRYVERDLLTLAEWAQRLRGTPEVELLYGKILAYPAKSVDETQTVEASIMQYAEDLRNLGRFSSSGDMFLAVANLSQGTRRAEAAYKAGVVYARSGLFEKAKTAWLLAANDTNDKRFSSLASERLDRLSK
jgi:hypothetical protein